MTGGPGDDPDDHPADRYRTRIDAALDEFSARKFGEFQDIHPDLAEFARAAIDFVADGKRLRPLFCRGGWLVGGGDPDDLRFDHAAAALEWLQGSALAHDDVMDGSDTRRGRPSLHREFAARHRERLAAGDPDQHGTAVAILLGDLMLTWTDEHFRHSGLPGIPDALPWLDRCKNEVTAGQYLDILAQAKESVSVEEAMLVVRYKTAKYTVERPLHLGAALTGADADVLASLSEVAIPLGEAFQLRDDVLGVFGDPSTTGKPAGDDLREGKRTALIARAIELTTGDDQAAITTLLGTSEGVPQLTAIIEESGALAAVEADITARGQRAESAIDRLPAPSRDFLRTLLLRATRRTR